MHCPKCGHVQEGGQECLACGVILVRMKPGSEVVSGIVDDLGSHGLAIVPNFIGMTAVRALRAETLALRDEGEFRRAGVGRGENFHIDLETRNDFVHWIDLNELSASQEVISARYEELRVAINQRLYLGLFSWAGHLTIYPSGAHYSRHLDRFQDALHRTVSTILYLNEDWKTEDGGQLRIYVDPDGRSIDVLPVGGTLVTFLADRFEHEVLTAGRERMSLTGWFARRG